MHRLRVLRGKLGLPAVLQRVLRPLHQRTRNRTCHGHGTSARAKLQRSVRVVLQVRVLRRQPGPVPVQESRAPGQVWRRTARLVVRE